MQTSACVHVSGGLENEVLIVKIIIKVKGPEAMLTPNFRLPQKEAIVPDPDIQMEDGLHRQIPVYQSCFREQEPNAPTWPP